MLEEEVALMAMQDDMRRIFKKTEESMDSNNAKSIGTKKTFREVREQ